MRWWLAGLVVVACTAGDKGTGDTSVGSFTDPITNYSDADSDSDSDSDSDTDADADSDSDADSDTGTLTLTTTKGSGGAGGDGAHGGTLVETGIPRDTAN